MRAEGAVMERPTPAAGVGDISPNLPVRPGDPDRDLVQALRRRDEAAAEMLVAAYGDRVYRLAVRITGNGADAEEVTQDALWSATRKIDTFRGASAFGSWIYRIAANAALQKRRSRRNEHGEVAWEAVAPSFDDSGRHVEPGLDWSPRLKDPGLSAELRSALSAAVDNLPGDYHTAFVFHDVVGLSNAEIADALQVKAATVKSRVHRAHLYLRARLGAYVDGATRAL